MRFHQGKKPCTPSPVLDNTKSPSVQGASQLASKVRLQSHEQPRRMAWQQSDAVQTSLTAYGTKSAKDTPFYDALCGSGITAKMAARGGASMVTTHSLAYFRMQGLSYGRLSPDLRRQCTDAGTRRLGTTNDRTYLRDKTGNRRFWPVKCFGVIWNAKSGMLMVDLEGLKRDRAQLWAEASVIEAAGEGRFLPEELWSAAKVQQRSREELDPWEDLIAIALAKKIEKGKDFDGKFAKASDAFGRAEWRVSSDWILTDILHLSTDRQNSFHAKTVAAIMRRLGWTRPDKVMRIAKGSPCHGYVKPASPIEIIPDDHVEILPPVGIRRI